MNRIYFFLLASLLIPASAFAAPAPASFSAARSLVTASSSPGNAYIAGVSVVITAPIKGDLSAVGGSVVVAAPVTGDEFIFSGSLSSRAPVTGDLRAAGGSITVEKPVAGDLVTLGFSVYDSGRVGGSVFIIAVNSTITDGAVGPVTIYGNNVSLAGNFASNVDVVATGRLTLAPDTKIHGTLSYEAPEAADIPASVTITGGIEYKNISYLPGADASRVLAFVSVGLFLFVRILGALILAGLLAGLFPRFVEVTTERVYTARLRSILLMMLLGFAILVATPILFIMLMLTFVGIEIALLIFILYVFVAFLSIMYAGILLGSVFVRRYVHRETVLWYDGFLGMFALSLITFVPFIGVFIVSLLTFLSAGALLLVFFNFAFPHEEHTPEML